MGNGELIERARRAMNRGHGFLLQQVGETRVAWGNEPKADLDGWPTSQICYLLPKDENYSTILRALAWLQDAQLMSGAWTTATYGLAPDTGSTSCCVIALAHHLGPQELTVQRGIRWICDAFDDGWSLQPSTENRFHRSKVYYTSYCLRALCRGEKDYLPAIILPQGAAALLELQNTDGGWPNIRGLKSDNSFTAYALHGLLDTLKYANVGVPEERIEKGIDFLYRNQNDTGGWADWHGFQDSADTTSYCVYVLLSSGVVSRRDPKIEKAINLICASQSDVGGWGFPTTPNEPLNWTTALTLLGLHSFINAKEIGAVPGSMRFDPQKIRRNKITAVALPSLDHIVSSSDAEALEPLFKVGETIRETAERSDHEGELRRAYKIRIADYLRHFPVTRSLEHSMAQAIDHYVEQKLPVQQLRKAIASRQTIAVHGIYGPHFERFHRDLGYDSYDHVPFNVAPSSNHTSQKLFNTYRPQFYWAEKEGKKALLCCVFPGTDYVLHYSSLVRHFALKEHTGGDDSVTIFQYPLVERSLGAWSGLNAGLVQSNDVVVLGYVEQLKKAMQDTSEFEYINEVDNEFYRSIRFRIRATKQDINLLGVKYCFWGSIAEILCAYLSFFKIREIIYFAKLGTLTAPGDIYSRIFCPTKYYVIAYNKVRDLVTQVPHGIVRQFAGLDSGAHASVPTVLEEDYVQRETLSSLNVSSIDNEVSKIARAVSVYNRVHGAEIRFSPIHIATDYVRGIGEQLLTTTHDLSTDKSVETRQRKEALLCKVCTEVLIPYLKSYK